MLRCGWGANMNEKRILIGFPKMAAFLGVKLPELLQRRDEMESVGIVETHLRGVRIYNVASPEALKRYWRERTFD